MNLEFMTQALLMGARVDNRPFGPGDTGPSDAIRNAEQRLELARILRAERTASEMVEQPANGIAARLRNVLSRA